jgi:hypothetical protein
MQASSTISALWNTLVSHLPMETHRHENPSASAGWLAAVPLAAMADPLPFEQFMRLHRDMPASELQQLAGKPDYVRTDPAGSGDTQLYWLGDIDLPYTTVITLHQGLISEIHRDKRM